MTTATISNKEVEETLRSVIQSLIDGQEGFKQIGEKLEDPTLKRYFAAESLKRASFRGELETVLHTHGVPDIKESGTCKWLAIHRAWAEVKGEAWGR